MTPLQSPRDYLFNLETTSKSDAKRLWRKQIKESWDHKCAYCGSEDNLTLDHIVPQCKGGMDVKTNVVACCHSCNQSKGHDHWKLWYVQQEFYNEKNLNKIDEWMQVPRPQTRNRYTRRANII
jgi:5-methylcytosine-specific restriction endonuclease McrA